MKRIIIMLTVAGLLAGARSLVAQSGGGYDLTWNTFDGGGGTSTGGGYALSGTVGQPDANTQTLAGGGYKLSGGFWPGMPCGLNIPADYDGDCDVDQGDYDLFEVCASGPGACGLPECFRLHSGPGLTAGCFSRNLR